MTTYNDLFESPEELVERRLEETAGNYSETLKEAGYKYIWDAFVKRAMDHGFYDAYRGAMALDKTASDDEFTLGQNEALEDIENLNPEWYDFLKEANDFVADGGNLEDFCKEAQNQEFAEYVLNAEEDLTTIAFKQPEKTHMNAYDFGKEAALNDLVDLYEAGYGYSDAVYKIQNTLNQELNKYASDEDVDIRLGIEGACHEFLKEASELFGDYDTSDLNDNEVLYFVLEKIAENREAALQKSPGTAMILHPTESGQAKSNRYNTARGQKSEQNKRRLREEGPTLRERGQYYAGRAKARAQEISRALPGTGKQQAGVAGGLAALGAAGAGYHQYKKRQEEKEARAMNHEVAEALAVLEAYGFEPEFE